MGFHFIPVNKGYDTLFLRSNLILFKTAVVNKILATDAAVIGIVLAKQSKIFIGIENCVGSTPSVSNTLNSINLCNQFLSENISNVKYYCYDFHIYSHLDKVCSH